MNRDLLYHYTTAPGFLGIVRDQNIRATNFSFLNDSTEVAYGLNLVAETVENFQDSTSDAPKDLDVQGVIASLNTFRDINDLYVACFTSLRDDLSQWRGYGGVEVDRFCIGIEKSSLATLRARRTTYSSANLVELIYDRETQRQQVVATLKNFDPTKRFKHELALDLSHLTLRFKNPAFAAEAEWRVAVATLGTGCEIAEFVVTAGRVRPFIELRTRNSAKLAIGEVVVLPSRFHAQALKAAQLVLERSGYPSEIARISEVPFVG